MKTNRKMKNKSRDHKYKRDKHDHHKSREGRQRGHLRSVGSNHGCHSGLGHSGGNAIEFLRNEAQMLETKLRSIKQRIKDMEEGTIPSELKAIINPELCIGCGKCVKACKYEAITVGEVAAVDKELCTGCGHCLEKCREGAISM